MAGTNHVVADVAPVALAQCCKGDEPEPETAVGTEVDRASHDRQPTEMTMSEFVPLPPGFRLVRFVVGVPSAGTSDHYEIFDVQTALGWRWTEGTHADGFMEVLDARGKVWPAGTRKGDPTRCVHLVGPDASVESEVRRWAAA